MEKDYLPHHLPSHFPKSKKEEEKFHSKKEVGVCKECGAFYYKKSWHKNLPKELENKEKYYTLCPACRMIKENVFEGEIRIYNVKKEKEEELLNAIKNAEELSQKRDPEDRIVKIQKKENEIIVWTTENQLAIKIAKKIKNSFKGEMKIHYSDKESTARVEIYL